jgi:hypothetical protein
MSLPPEKKHKCVGQGGHKTLLSRLGQVGNDGWVQHAKK